MFTTHHKSLLLVLALVLGTCGLLGCQPQNFGCALDGTLIATPEGPKPIETLAIGDRVLTQLDSGERAIGSVTAIAPAKTREYLVITFADGKQLRVTDQHPIATDAGFTPAGELHRSSIAKGMDGPTPITSIERVRDPATVRDITVEPGNTFFAQGILVHNKSLASFWPTFMQMSGDWLDEELQYWMTVAPDGAITVRGRYSTWLGAFPATSDVPPRLHSLAGTGRDVRVQLTPTTSDEAHPLVLRLNVSQYTMRGTLTHDGKSRGVVFIQKNAFDDPARTVGHGV